MASIAAYFFAMSSRFNVAYFLRVACLFLKSSLSPSSFCYSLSKFFSSSSKPSSFSTSPAIADSSSFKAFILSKRGLFSFLIYLNLTMASNH
jgi:hypothetical protein